MNTGGRCSSDGTMISDQLSSVMRNRNALQFTRWAVLTMVYFVAATVGALLIPSSANIPFIWPAGGIALAALLISARSNWAGIVLVIVVTDLAAHLVTRNSLVVSFWFSLVNCAQSLGSAWLLQRYLGPVIRFNRLKQVIWFCGITVLASILAGLAEAVVAVLNSNLPFTLAWSVSALANGVGILLVAPFILTWARRRISLRAVGVRAWVEIIFFITTLVIFSIYVFLNAYQATHFLEILPYFAFPLLFWGALRFGPHGASGAILALAVFLVSGTLLGRGLFTSASLSLNEQAVTAQAFLGISAISAYLAAAIFAERQDAEKALRESEVRMSTTMLNAPVIITEMDREGNIIYQNRGTSQLAPATSDTDVFAGITPECQVEFSDAIVRTFETGKAQRVEICSSDEVGNTFWYDVRLGPNASEVGVSTVTMIATDITERKRAEEALRQSEERYSLAAQGANDGIWDWDLQTNRVYYSPRWKQLLGYKDDAISVSPDEWLGRIHPEDVKYVKEDISTYLNGAVSQLISEHRIMHRSGSYRWFLVRGVAVSKNGGKPHRLAGSMTDITARKVTEERLRHDAMHDTLTNLSNRTYFNTQLQRSIDLVRRHSEYMAAVLFIDLDRFKVVNESLGHSAGDQLLVTVARRLETCIRPEDTAARFGGDEFCILLEEIKGINDAIRVANRVQARLNESFDLQSHEVYISVSTGINLVTPNYEKAEDLMRDAEMAMYQAKFSGRARYQLFDKEMHAHSLAMFKLEAELRGALDRQEFQVYYQPIYNSITGHITCVEALLRWHHPERGLIYPDQFIPLAEDTGLVVAMGEWVLRTVCEQIHLWQSLGVENVRVAVNISAHQLQDPNFPGVVRSALAVSGIAGTSLQLEITESAAMEDFDLTVRALNELIQMGIQISLDDFGMRYSSLDYLKRFPVDTIKIDKSFVWDISDNPDDAAITSAIISVAHILKLNVVAEGVETRQQLEFLLLNQCDEIQGHLYSRAQASDAVTKLLTEHAQAVPNDNLG